MFFFRLYVIVVSGSYCPEASRAGRSYRKNNSTTPVHKICLPAFSFPLIFKTAAAHIQGFILYVNFHEIFVSKLTFSKKGVRPVLLQDLPLI